MGELWSSDVLLDRVTPASVPDYSITTLAVGVEETAEMPPAQDLCILDLGWDNNLTEEMGEEQSRAVYNKCKTVSEEVEDTVEDEECKQVEEKVCRNVHKMECQDTPEEVERQVPHEVCWDEAEESRHDAPREVCHQVPRDVSTVVAENAYTKTDVEVCPPVPREEKKKPKTSWDCEIFNESKPILTRRPDKIEQGEYDEFCQSITKDKSGPMTQTHSIAKGEGVFRSLIFVPNSQPSEQFNKFGQAAENVELYVGGVFITDDFKDMIPSHLSFDKGVVDSDDKYG